MQPIPFTTTRYRCPCCPRTASNGTRMREHIGRCWLNPAAKGCKTCKHFESYGPENEDVCWVGVDLTGRPQCKTCGGFGDVPGEGLGITECPDCAGDGSEIKPGPIVGCDQWEANADFRTPDAHGPGYPCEGAEMGVCGGGPVHDEACPSSQEAKP